MCGIAGVVSTTGRPDRQRVEQMSEQLEHRGPEGKGFYTDPDGVAMLAHRRLCIIDTSEESAQPMCYDDRFHIIHNGELYNYIELRGQLEAKGRVFQTRSDTEVIVAAFAEYGTKCLEHFNGMFAFVIWDEREKSLFAARDRFGEKPLFYAFDGRELVFASEIKALWHYGVQKEVNRKMLYNFLTIDYTSNPGDPSETFYEGICKLPAASFLQYASVKNELTVERYWQVYPESSNLADAEAVDRFTELMSNSVKIRLRSDVPVGTSLSGGLDSSTIVAFCDRLANGAYTHKCFTSSNPGFEKDETRYAKAVAEKFYLEHHLSTVSDEEVVTLMERMMRYQEEPVISGSPLLQFRLYETAKSNGVTVLLDGQGADETLAGYTKYYRWYWQELYRNHKLSSSKELVKARELGVQESFSLKNKFAAILPDLTAGIYQSRKTKNAGKRSDLSESLKEINRGRSYYALPAHFDLNGMLHFNSFVYGLEELLKMADRNSMAHATEVRLPFLDHRLVEFLFTLPPHHKIRNGWTKWILRKSSDPLLPADITWRKDKVGYEPPQERWMQTADVQSAISEAKKLLVQQDVLDRSVLHKKIQPHGAHAAVNRDWKYWSASFLFRS